MSLEACDTGPAKPLQLRAGRLLPPPPGCARRYRPAVTEGPQWQYRVSELRSPNGDAIQEHLDLWAAAGWELVNGSTTTMEFFEVHRGRYPDAVYTMWWRRPATS